MEGTRKIARCENESYLSKSTVVLAPTSPNNAFTACVTCFLKNTGEISRFNPFGSSL